MRSIARAAAALACLACLAALPAGTLAAQNARPQIMIVGTYHMANPGQDFVNVVADDVLAPKRQTEIARLVELLAAFRPTVVALEYVPQRDSAMNARYRDFRAGSYTLTRGETEQVGFRLAGALGLARVNGIDFREDLDINSVMTFAMASEFRPFGVAVQEELQRMMTSVNRLLNTRTIPEIIAEHNGPMMVPLHAFYLRAAQVGRDTNYVGARMASAWYDRNLRIYSNISRLVSKRDERVLVLIGAGHAPILRDFVRAADEWEIVDPVPYLKK